MSYRVRVLLALLAVGLFVQVAPALAQSDVVAAPAAAAEFDVADALEVLAVTAVIAGAVKVHAVNEPSCPDKYPIFGYRQNVTVPPFVRIYFVNVSTNSGYHSHNPCWPHSNLLDLSTIR